MITIDSALNSVDIHEAAFNIARKISYNGRLGVAKDVNGDTYWNIFNNIRLNDIRELIINMNLIHFCIK